ncbi:MAG: site-2 protease family protein [Thermoplasmata archaeon]|nr:site-2 protease family protein [Thermoplasmata archaeon]
MGAPIRGTTPPNPSSELERLRNAVGVYFPVYETRLTPQSLLLLVHADPATLEERFDRLRQELWTQYYIPTIRRDRGEFIVEVIRRPRTKTWSSWTNLVLLVLTVATTVAAGGFLWLAYVGGNHLVASDFFWGGLTFALPLMGILGIHELAHYVVARHHHVEASVPYFIPLPPPFVLFGTFGAFISLREPIPSKKALLDIGASGPLAGFAVAIPVTALGMFLSAHAPVLSVANCGPSVLGVSYGNLTFGTSLFWFALSKFVPVAFLNLHPVALAGWVGLLVTAMNLLPTSQLDGGHVFRALLGDRYRWVSWAGIIALFGMGILYSGWFIFALLLLFMGARHPPPLNDITPLDRKRWAVGGVAVLILVSAFVIIPLSTPTGNYNVTTSAVSAQVNATQGMQGNASLTIVNSDEISHGYLFSAEINVVEGNVSGAIRPLPPAELASFELNSTWTILFPNGNQTTIRGTGNFTLPEASYVKIDAGQQSTVVVIYSNPKQASVSFTVGVTELCGFGGSAQAFHFDVT